MVISGWFGFMNPLRLSISGFTDVLIVLFAELCLRNAENSFRMIENVLNMLDKPSL